MKHISAWCLILALCAALALPVLAAEEEDLLTLVNPWNTVPQDWKVDLVSLGGGQRADRRCADDLLAMLEACKAAGHKPLVRSSYRTYNTQKTLYANKVAQWKGYGYSDRTAREKAAAIVAPPGTSEHQLGLAFDLVDNNFRVLDQRQADTATQQWLMEHSWEYGFILRYPSDKSEITGIIYEPWHYRYVGRENAKAIYDSGLCLEEWLARRQQLKAVEEAIQADLQKARRRSFVHLWHKNCNEDVT